MSPVSGSRPTTAPSPAVTTEGPTTTGVGVAGLACDQNSANEGGNLVGAAGALTPPGPSTNTVLWISLRDQSASPTTRSRSVADSPGPTLVRRPVGTR